MRNYRQLYFIHPQPGGPVPREVRGFAAEAIHQAAPDELVADALSLPSWWGVQIQQEATGELQLAENQRVCSLTPSTQRILRHFSFTHFVQPMRSDVPLKRAFCKIKGIKGNRSVPRLKRQTETLLHERAGMSKGMAGLVDAAHAEKRVATIDDANRDPYLLELPGFAEDCRFSEHDLEGTLICECQ